MSLEKENNSWFNWRCFLWNGWNI